MSPFRLDQFRTKIAFVTYAGMPSQVYQACKITGTVSLTRYYQEAVCQRLATDLGIPLENLLARLPPPRGKAATLLMPPDGPRVGPANTDEEVR